MGKVEKGEVRGRARGEFVDCGECEFAEEVKVNFYSKSCMARALPGSHIVGCNRGIKFASYYFVLRRKGWGYDDIYEALKSGEKTSEYRDGSDFWKSRLLTEMGRQQIIWAYEIRDRNPGQVKPFFLMPFPKYLLKHDKARFVVGYTKRPMLIADVKEVMFDSKRNQFEIQIENVREVK